MESALNPKEAHDLIREMFDELDESVSGKIGREMFLKKCDVILKLKKSPSASLNLSEAKRWASAFKERI